MRRARLVLFLGSLAMSAAALPVLLIQPGCSPGACSQSLLDPNQPSPALECAAGLLCYQGQCIKACSAGQEGAQECSGDGDCDGSRPNCIDGFCSACEEGEYCVPTLNICQPITEVDLSMIEPPPTPPPGAPKPPAPLDAGYIDGGIRLDKDAGIETPIDAVVTYAGLVDVAQIADYTGGGQPIIRSRINATMLYVGEVETPGLVWRVDPWDDVGPGYPPATEMILEEVLGEDCTLSLLTTDTASVTYEEDFGDIIIDSAPEFPDSLTIPGVVIPYDGFEYTDPTGLPSTLLRFSILSPSEPHFLTISSPGGFATSGAWPNPAPDNGEHVPFELVASPETTTALMMGFVVNRATPGDLTVRWNRIGAGVVSGEAVVLRFRSPTHEVNCKVIEGTNSEGTVTVKAGLLRSFIDLAGAGPGANYPIYFERAFARRVEVPPAEADEVIDVAVRVRHTLISNITFN